MQFELLVKFSRRTRTPIFHLPFLCEEGGKTVLAKKRLVAGERMAFERPAGAEIADDEIGICVFALNAEEGAA